MISFKGHDDVIERVYHYKQDHVFSNWDSLNDWEKRELLTDLAEIDFDLLGRLFAEAELSDQLDYDPAPYIPIPKTEAEMKRYREAAHNGEEYIRQGKVAAFIVAGGQGSRLGFEGPKGKFPVAPVSGKTLFQIHAEKIVKYSRKYDTTIPLIIMTSRQNHNETVDFFEKNDYFGLKGGSVFIFPQNMIPSLDTGGRIILQDRKSVFKNPDGHGGSITALQTSGTLAAMKKEGIKTVSYLQVDNPLVKIIDPPFIGYHIMEGADVSSKALRKAYPEEKVGVFVKFSNNRIGVIEYSDLPSEKANQRDREGELMFSSGSIAIHLFEADFIKKVTAGRSGSLPFHRASKKIRAFAQGSEKEIDGLKFEKFVFDALPLTDKNIVYETKREEEFAPVKNATGVDSVESAQKLMIDLHRQWLKDRGIAIPGKTRVVEISPLLAVEPDDLYQGITIHDEEKVYLGSKN